jgi:acetyltransferase-like isoleucine patch superfamily enzyme
MFQNTKHWLKTADTPLSRLLYQMAWQLMHFELPPIKPLGKAALVVHLFICRTIQTVLRICYWTPLFKANVEGDAKHLYLYGGLPFISGPLNIEVGERCRISGQTTFSGRTVPRVDGQQPLLSIGNNVDISWQTTIAVGTVVSIGDNVRIAGRGFLAGYPGHPINPQARAQGKPDDESQAGDIVLEDDVWLATGVSVMAGVRIGKGCIVAAGSVVTHDLPAGVLAAGIPAKVIKKLEV